MPDKKRTEKIDGTVATIMTFDWASRHGGNVNESINNECDLMAF